MPGEKIKYQNKTFAQAQISCSSSCKAQAIVLTVFCNDPSPIAPNACDPHCWLVSHASSPSLLHPTIMLFSPKDDPQGLLATVLPRTVQRHSSWGLSPLPLTGSSHLAAAAIWHPNHNNNHTLELVLPQPMPFLVTQQLHFVDIIGKGPSVIKIKNKGIFSTSSKILLSSMIWGLAS